MIGLRLSLIAALWTLCGCDREPIWTDAIENPPVDAGWHYRVGVQMRQAYYGFGNPANSYFRIACSPRFGFPQPVFFLFFDYDDQWPTRVSLTAKDLSRTFQVFPERHSGNLMWWVSLEDPLLDQLSATREGVTIATDSGWRRTLPATAHLRRVISDCRRLLEAPAARL